MEFKSSHFVKTIFKDLFHDQPNFSLRRFSAKIGVSPSYLSQIFASKRVLTSQVALKLSDEFKLSKKQMSQLSKYIAADKNRIAYLKEQKRVAKSKFEVIESDNALIVSEWQHFAIVNLAHTRGFVGTPDYISRRLGISVQSAKQSLARLLENGLLVQIGKKIHPARTQFTTTADIPSGSIRKHHLSVLEMSKQKLESVPVEYRDFSSFSFSFESRRIAEAKKDLEKLRRKFARKYESENFGDEVYTFNLQFFPVTEITLT